MNPLNQLFLTELADRYDAEKRLLRSLPKIARAASCKQLQKLLQLEYTETTSHLKKLELVFRAFDAKITSKKCEATVGLLKEGEEITAIFKGTAAINAALISVAQKLKHYEIASYGCLHEWAVDLENQEASTLLKGILTEVRDANEALIKLARSSSNKEALAGGDAAPAADVKAKKLPVPRRAVRPVKLVPAPSLPV